MAGDLQVGNSWLTVDENAIVATISGGPPASAVPEIPGRLGKHAESAPRVWGGFCLPCLITRLGPNEGRNL